jgi:hypothetical protein
VQLKYTGAGVEVQFQAFFTLALDAGELSALYRGRFIVCQKEMGEHWGRLFLIGEGKKSLQSTGIVSFSIHYTD